MNVHDGVETSHTMEKLEIYPMGCRQTQGLIQSKVFAQLRFNFAYYVCFPPVWQQATLLKPDVIYIFQSLHPFLEYSNLKY